MRGCLRIWLTLIGAGAAIAVSGSAFTAGLTGDQSSNAGTSATVIGGYEVSNVSYTLNATTPTNIDAILFTIVNPGAEPSFVRAQAVDPGGTFYTCSTVLNGSDYDATCNSTSPQLTVAAANQMTIVVSK